MTIALLYVVGVPLLMCALAWGLCRAAAKPTPTRDWDDAMERELR